LHSLKISKKWLNTLVLATLLIAACAPTEYAKQLVAVAVGLLAAILMQPKNLIKHSVMKLFVLVTLAPGLAQALFYSPAEALRFAPIILLVLAFPYGTLSWRAGTLRTVIALLILWLFVSQVLIAFNFTPMTSFREAWYPIEKNVWDYGSIDTLSFDLRSFRAGGLYYNPNVLGLMVILLLFAYYYLQRLEITAKTRRLGVVNSTHSTGAAFIFPILAIAGVSIWLTGSRTALGGLFVLVFALLGRRKFGGKISINNLQKIVLIVIVILGFYHSYASFDEGILGAQGSARIKYEILINYLANSSILQLLFGGTYDLHFDAEYGYWIGASGILGMVGILSFVAYLSKTFPSAVPLVLVYLLMAVGNTLFYGLLTASLLLVILPLSAQKNNFEIKMKSTSGHSSVESWAQWRA
jgi:hypothetical protein